MEGFQNKCLKATSDNKEPIRKQLGYMNFIVQLALNYCFIVLLVIP